MTEQQVSEIETTLAMTLPPHYRRFLLDFPPSLFRAKAKDGDEWRPMQADSLMFHTVRSFVEYNRLAHAADKEPWPSNYFVIGTDGGGDYWFIDLNDTDETTQQVFQFDSEFGPILVPSPLDRHVLMLEALSAVR